MNGVIEMKKVLMVLIMCVLVMPLFAQGTIFAKGTVDKDRQIFDLNGNTVVVYSKQLPE